MRQKQADNKIHFTPDNLTEFVTGEMNWKNSTIVGLYVTACEDCVESSSGTQSEPLCSNGKTGRP